MCNVGIVFTKSRVILCEGSSDKAFFTELISRRNLPEIQVYFPHGANHRAGGNTMFGRSLRANRVSAVANFGIVKSILVVSDNDNDPASRLQLVKDQLNDAGYTVPQNELEFVQSPDGRPDIAIMMLPLLAQHGNLETVCRGAVEHKWNDLVPTLDAFTNASPAKDWNVGHLDKMRIQCLLAATCEPNPNASLSGVFQENERFHPPLDHASFDAIADFLANWDASLPARGA